MKHRSMTLGFTSITEMMRNMNKLKTLELKKGKLQNQEIKRKKLKRMKRSLW